ncbi:TPA: phage tail protein, partial [Citrobacter freundii]|nr:phage tail protein [Citrobacter freundii]HDV8526209.1 phage tail protein [Citrobacter freundii]HDZ8374217.1 phage tail protein [Citrobacter freundii]
MKKNDTASVTAEGGVTLAQPIVRSEETITYVEIGEEIKQSGSLRGLSLSDVLNMKTDTLVTLFTRV